MRKFVYRNERVFFVVMIRSLVECFLYVYSLVVPLFYRYLTCNQQNNNNNKFTTFACFEVFKWIFSVIHGTCVYLHWVSRRCHTLNGAFNLLAQVQIFTVVDRLETNQFLTKSAKIDVYLLTVNRINWMFSPKCKSNAQTFWKYPQKAPKWRDLIYPLRFAFI